MVESRKFKIGFIYEEAERRDLTKLSADVESVKEFLKNVQVVFQEPFSSLNPRKTVKEI